MNTNYHSINPHLTSNTLEDSKAHRRVLPTIPDPVVLSQVDGEAKLNTKKQPHNGTEMLVLVFMHPNQILVFH